MGPAYFAYGSNLSPRQMQQRCPGARLVAPARLRGHRLAFDRYSARWRGYVADVVPAASADTWGVLWELMPGQIETLDRYEGVASGAYERCVVDVELLRGETVTAVTYRVVAPGESGAPSAAYLATIREGARAHALPGSYLRYLEKLAPATSGD